MNSLQTETLMKTVGLELCIINFYLWSSHALDIDLSFTFRTKCCGKTRQSGPFKPITVGNLFWASNRINRPKPMGQWPALIGQLSQAWAGMAFWQGPHLKVATVQLRQHSLMEVLTTCSKAQLLNTGFSLWVEHFSTLTADLFSNKNSFKHHPTEVPMKPK